MDIVRIGNDIQFVTKITNLDTYDTSDIYSIECIVSPAEDCDCHDLQCPSEFTIHGCGDHCYNVLPHRHWVQYDCTAPFVFGHSCLFYRDHFIYRHHHHKFGPHCCEDRRSQTIPFTVDIENGIVTAVYKNTKQFHCGTYKYKIVITLKEEGYGETNLHTYTLDYGVLFSLICKSYSEQGDVVINDDGTHSVRPKGDVPEPPATKYTITFMVDDEVYHTISLFAGDAIVKPEDPTKDGCEFIDWNPTVPSVMPAENLTVSARWSYNTYIITFNTNGGSTINSIVQKFGTAVTAPANPTKTGYTFSGWTPAVPTIMPAQNTECVASWTINKYTATFKSDGVVKSTRQFEYNSTIEFPEVTKAGHQFSGWSPSNINKMPARDIEFNAVWDVTTYDVIFKVDNTEYKKYTIAYGQSIPTPTNPTKTGYTFNGWDAEIPATMPNHQLVFNATWNINKYNVKFIANGNTIYDQNLEYNSPISAPAAPAVEGKTFSQWNPNVPAKVPAYDCTFTAVYTNNPTVHTVYYGTRDTNPSNVPITVAEIESCTPTNSSTLPISITSEGDVKCKYWASKTLTMTSCTDDNNINVLDAESAIKVGDYTVWYKYSGVKNSITYKTKFELR